MQGEPMLRMQEIDKSFAGVRVLSRVSLELGRGEILGVVGENGAGKSTLMNVLGGVLRMDAGAMVLDGKPYAPASPKEASDAGVAFIHQELNLFSNLTVAENMFLDQFPTGFAGRIRFGQIRKAAAEYLTRYEVPARPDTRIEALPMGARQMVEIAKAVSFDSDVLIMDEPTSALSETEVSHLFRIIRQLRAQGKGIVYITHKMDEVFAITDEVSVYRDGEFLVREDEESQEIFVLLTGALVVERDAGVPGTPPAVLACISAEDGVAIVGEMAYLGALRRTASVRCSGMTRVLCLRPEHIDRIIDGFPMLTRVICTQFSRRLQETLQALSRFQARFALNPGRKVAQDGDVLFARGDSAPEQFITGPGAVRLERDGAPPEVLGPEAFPQGFLDLDAYLGGRPHAATARVEGMAFLAVLGLEDRPAVVRTFPELAIEVLERGRVAQ